MREPQLVEHQVAIAFKRYVFLEIISKIKAKKNMAKMKNFKFKRAFLDSSSILNISTKNRTLKQFMNLYEEKYYYNSTGDPGWYKIFHLNNTGGWGGTSLLFFISGSTFLTDMATGIAEITYYDNDTISTAILNGNGHFVSDNLKYVKNSDNTLDVYLRITAYYRPVVVKILSFYGVYERAYSNLFDNCGYAGNITLSATGSFSKV